MHTLIGSCHSFIRGRLASNNIQVVQEPVHALSRWKGKKAEMILKVDFEKAYDKVDWQFLRHILNISGFRCILISLIMDIITSASLRVCWNGEALATFSPSRGLTSRPPTLPILIYLVHESIASLNFSNDCFWCLETVTSFSRRSKFVSSTRLFMERSLNILINMSRKLFEDNSQLGRWNLFSRVARFILIQTTLMAIPLYTMQTISLHVAVIN